MTNLARFTIDGTPSSQGGYDVDPGDTPVLALEASSQLVGRVTFEVHSATTGSPRATTGAPLLTLNNGITTGAALDAATPASTVTISAGIPASRYPHLWEVRCKVNGGTNTDGSVNPGYVFSRFLAMRAVNGRRKIMPSERGEYSPTESWASAYNDQINEGYVVEAEDGLIDLFDADVGLATYGGMITEWRGSRGHVARPLTVDMATGTMSNGRTAVAFNGTTQGMTIEIPELRRNNSSLIIAMQFYPRSNSNAQWLAQLWKAEGTTSVLELSSQGGTLRAGAHLTNDSFGSAVNNASSHINTEYVAEAVRNSHSSLLYLYENGALSDSTQTDVLLPQPASTTLSIGCRVGETVTGFFDGFIRRIAIYGHTRTTWLAANAASRDLEWRGL